MKIISTKLLFEIESESWRMQLSPLLFRFLKQSKVTGDGKYRLILELVISEKATGIGASNVPIEQSWILNSEVNASLNQSNPGSYFEFELIGRFDPFNKIYIKSNDFINFIIINDVVEDFSIENISATIGLSENEMIKGLLVESLIVQEKRFSKFKSPEFYEENFGIKSEEEKILIQKVKDIIKACGRIDGAGFAIDIYTKVIEMNPNNAGAYFQLALSILDNLKGQRTNQALGFSSFVILSEEEYLQDAERNFNKAVSLNPYLAEELNKLKKSGHVRL